MMQLGLRTDSADPLTILCLGAHSDDIEIGCGGTILYLSSIYPRAEFHWVVFSACGVRADEARRAAELFVPDSRLKLPMLKTFQDGFMPYNGGDVKTVFESLKSISPDLIFTHNSHDAHQDHRLVSELTWNTFRDHLILEYEIPKYDGDLGRPSVFVPLASELAEKKVDHLMKAFGSQRSKRWFTPDLFFSLMRLRGMECNSRSGYSEAFYCRKLLVQAPTHISPLA